MVHWCSHAGGWIPLCTTIEGWVIGAAELLGDRHGAVDLRRSCWSVGVRGPDHSPGGGATVQQPLASHTNPLGEFRGSTAPYRRRADPALRAADDCETIALNVGEYQLIRRIMSESGHTELTDGIWT